MTIEETKMRIDEMVKSEFSRERFGEAIFELKELYPVLRDSVQADGNIATIPLKLTRQLLKAFENLSLQINAAQISEEERQLDDYLVALERRMDTERIQLRVHQSYRRYTVTEGGNTYEFPNGELLSRMKTLISKFRVKTTNPPFDIVYILGVDTE